MGVDWDEVKPTTKLSHTRSEQLLRCGKCLDEDYKKIMEAVSESVTYWDQRMAHKLRKNSLQVGDLVLVHHGALESQWGKLVTNRWNGPFRVKKQLSMGSHILEELDGVELKRCYAFSHFERFYLSGTGEE